MPIPAGSNRYKTLPIPHHIGNLALSGGRLHDSQIVEAFSPQKIEALTVAKQPFNGTQHKKAASNFPDDARFC